MRHHHLPRGLDFRHHGHADRQYRARAVTAVAGGDPAAERLDKAAADRQAEAGPGSAAVLRLDAIKLVEDTFGIRGRNPGPFIDDLDFHELSVAARANVDAPA